MFIFTIFDKTAGRAGNLFTAETYGDAERQFTNLIRHAEQGSLFNSNPDDFILYSLGKFDPYSPVISDVSINEITTGSKVLVSPVSS